MLAGVGPCRQAPLWAARLLAENAPAHALSGRSTVHFFLVFFVAVNDISDMFSCASGNLNEWQAAAM